MRLCVRDSQGESEKGSKYARYHACACAPVLLGWSVEESYGMCKVTRGYDTRMRYAAVCHTQVMLN